MDVREKLVELLKKFVPTIWYEDCDGIRHEKCDEIHCSECIADRLIAHGVTVQECGHWIKTETNYTCSNCGGNVISWTGDYDGYERERGICLMNYCPHCGTKMMPEPPKGE